MSLYIGKVCILAIHLHVTPALPYGKKS